MYIYFFGGIGMKKLLSFGLLLVLCGSLIGCSSNVAESENIKDDITFEGCEIKDDGSGYYTCTFKVKNNTDKKMTFQGISIYELDSNGDILDTWKSYNQSTVDADLEPGQSISFETTHEISSGIEQIKSTSYEYEDENEIWIEEDFLEPIIVDLKK